MRRHEQDGTKVNFGVECENQVVRDGYVLAPLGSKCSLGCEAQSGEAFRVDTTTKGFECKSPIPQRFFSQSLTLVYV